MKKIFKLKTNYLTNQFIGREEEIKHLSSVLNTIEQGSVLISGVRGVGKTAFVKKVLEINKKKEREEENEEKQTIDIYINANQIEDKDEKAKERSLLKNIITHLYFTLSKSLKAGEEHEEYVKKAQELYEKVRGEYTKSSKIENINQNTSEITKTLQTNVKIPTETFFVLIAIFLLNILSFSLFDLFLKLLEFIKGESFLLIIENYVVKVVSFISSSILIGLSYSEITKHIHKTQDNISIEEIRKEDNSTATLEYDLIELLEKLEEEYQIVFIIDELDKLYTQDPNEDKITDLIKSYKNLFTVSKATFIFITDQSYYEKYKDAKRETDNIYTLFSYSYFISKPKYQDLSDFLVNIFPKEEQDDENFDTLKDFLLFQSDNDYFNLKKLLHEITQFDTGNIPYIDISLLKYSDIEYKAMLGKVITNYFSFSESPIPYYWYKNYQTISEAIVFVKKLFRKQFKIERSNAKLPEEIGIVTLSEFDKLGSEKEVIAEIMELVDYLEYLKILKGITGSGDGEGNRATVFVWTNRYPTKAALENPDYIKKYEQDFISAMEELNNLNKTFSKEFYRKKEETIEEQNAILSTIGIDPFPVYMQNEPLYRDLNNLPRRSHEKDIVVSNTKTIQELIRSIKDSTSVLLDNLIRREAQKQNIILESTNNLLGSPALLSFPPDLRDNLSSSLHRIISMSTKNNSKEILILQDYENIEILNKYKKVINSNKDSLFIVDIINNKRPVQKVFASNFVFLEKGDYIQTKKIVDNIVKWLIKK